MIWVLVITLIASGADRSITNVVGNVEAYPSERGCEAAKAAFIEFHRAAKKPNLALSIGCSELKLPGVI